jgi:hypothetical protein
LDHLSDGTIGVVCGGAAIVVCLAAVWLADGSTRLVRHLLRRRLPAVRLPRIDVRASSLHLAQASAAGLVAAGIAFSPLGSVVDGQPAVVDVSASTVAAVTVPAPSILDARDAAGAVVAPSSGSVAAGGATARGVSPGLTRSRSLAAARAGAGPARGGSIVAVEGSDYRYVLTVDGAPSVVRGMGYNPWYASLPTDQRQALYERDFAAMQQIGVNTLEGWFQDQFDEVTLDAAQRHGIKVIMPFELNQDYDYSDPAVKDRFRREVKDWVLRYRDHPAVLMWGPGNEVMHRLIFPTAVQGKKDAAQEARADAYGAFYVELMDMVHDLDPNHPVIYRDAEDLYFARFRQSLQQDGKPRPWFIYGMNVYTQRLAEDIDRWPTQGVDAPLLISEFSPGGVGPQERPKMFGWYWSAIRAKPEMVLGGIVYTWATQGPEDLDRVFGLTDPNGVPVDGSVEALGQLFREDEARARGR